MCQPATTYGGNGSFFVPMMVGYMLGSATSTPAPLYYGPGSYRHPNSATIYSSAPGYTGRAIGTAPYVAPAKTSKGSLKSSTNLTPVQRGGFGSSFKPTTSFKSIYAAKNPNSFGRGAYSKSTGAMSAKSYSSYKSSGYSSSRSSSVSRGGFGSSGRSFGGGYGG
jgi:uncharacterized protein YgiB involved in biofilm formation